MYTSGKYLLFKEPMNLRKNPSKSSQIVLLIPQGEVLTVEKTQENWGFVCFNGEYGWCCISECFAKKICGCNNSECEYYEKYMNLVEKNKKIKAILEA